MPNPIRSLQELIESIFETRLQPGMGEKLEEIKEKLCAFLKKADTLLENQNAMMDKQNVLLEGLNTIKAFLGIEGPSGGLSPSDQTALDNISQETEDLAAKVASISTQPPEPM